MNPGTGAPEKHDGLRTSRPRARGSRRSHAVEFSKTGAAGHEKGLRLAPKALSGRITRIRSSEGSPVVEFAGLSRGLSRQPGNGSKAWGTVKLREAAETGASRLAGGRRRAALGARRAPLAPRCPA